MLFSSEVFVFLFLPIVWLGYQALQLGDRRRVGIAWLVLASFVFYGWFEVRYLLLIGGMILGNYWTARLLLKAQRHRGAILTAGVTGNLVVLAYYKYANFLIANVNALTGLDLALQTVLLPIGISFFTFQLIAYLADVYRGQAQEYDFLDFCLFITFFPQLIAGPIVHHGELVPQFKDPRAMRPRSDDVAGGLVLFTIGLAKKIVLADQVAPLADGPFAAAQAGAAVDPLSAWCATLAFTLQIYFDFSAYSDMALGLAMLFGIRLPMNFNSPYKATSIVDFWRRWHITLSRFLRDYVYIALGGNRRGPARRYVNLMLTMLIGGLWHGAAWTFVVWGALHGLYLMVNHAWHAWRESLGVRRGCLGAAGPWVARLTTFFCVVLAWVFFRAGSFEAATTMLEGLAGFAPASAGGAYAPADLAQLAVLLLIVAGTMLLPNALELAASFHPALEPVGKGRPARLVRRLVEAPAALPLATGAALGAVVTVVLAYQGYNIERMQAFIYFQF